MRKIATPPINKWLYIGMAVIFVAILYLYYLLFSQKHGTQPLSSSSTSSLLSSSSSSSSLFDTTGFSGKPDINDPYMPPLKPPPITKGIPEALVPVSTSSRNADPTYQQIGILTKDSGKSEEPLILPLMARNLMNGRDKWQYYTMTNTPGAAISSRLPVSSNGKSCTSEYGCDGVTNGDSLFVDGYNDTFKAMVYDTAGLEYNPFRI